MSIKYFAIFILQQHGKAYLQFIGSLGLKTRIDCILKKLMLLARLIYFIIEPFFFFERDIPLGTVVDYWFYFGLFCCAVVEHECW